MSEAQYDLVIRGGTIVDGTGAPRFQGDVAINGEWIAEVGTVTGRGAREIDASGLLVTPGFTDIHTHYDGQLIWTERMSPSSDHGVTTVVTGNCGIGFAPCRKQDHMALIELMEGVEDIPEPVTSAGLTWEWETFPEFLDAIDARSHDIDVATMLPHSPLRVYVMGERAIRREEATEEDLQRMKALTAEALAAGAIGVGTSRISHHRSSTGEMIPSFGAAEQELHTIAEALKEAGSGVFQMVSAMGGEGLAREFGLMRDISQRSGRPVTYTQAQTPDNPEQWRDVLAMLDDANANGADIKAQLFPRPIGMMIGLNASANPFCTTAAWNEIKDLPLAEKVARMRDPEMRRRLIEEEPENLNNPLALMARNFTMTFPLDRDNPNYEPRREDSIAERAKAAGIAPEELVYDLLLEEDGNALLLVALGNFAQFSLDFAIQMLRNPNVIVGLGDGGAHYGMICDASYTTFALAHWARDRQGDRFTVEEAVRLLARDPAEVVGLLDRGLLQPGYRAHVNVIDHDRLRLFRPELVHDLPGGGKRLHQRADGYVATIVNGAVIMENGQATGELPGRLLRGPQDIQQSAPTAVAAE